MIKNNSIVLDGDRKASALATKSTSDTLQKLIDSSLDVICSFDEHGRFLTVSAAAKLVWGYEPEDLVGKYYIDFVIEEDKELTRKAASDIMAGTNMTNFENRYLCKDGSIKPLLWSARWDDVEKVMYSVARDATEKKQVEQRNILQEQRLYRAYKLAKIAWWEYDIKTQTYTSSDEIFEMYGLPIPPNNQTSIEEFLTWVHPEDVPRLMHDLTFHCDDVYFNYEHRIIKPSGEVIYVIHYSQLIRDEEGVPVALHGTTKNITERKLYQLQLEASEKKLKQYSTKLSDTLESIGDGFFTVDREWNITYWNNKAESLLWKKKEEVLGKNLWEEYKEAIPLKFYDEYFRAMQQKVNVHFEEYFPPLEMWIEVNAYPSNDGLSVYFKDITDRKNSERELKSINERFRLVSKATSDAIWDWNIVSGDCFFNQSFTHLFGYTNLKDPVEEIWIGNIHKEDKGNIIKSLYAALEDAAINQWQNEYRFLKADGQVAYVLDRGFIIRNGEGKAIRMVGSMQDITKLKEAERRIEKKERKFRAMVQSGNDLITLLDQSGKITYVSPNHPQQLGFSENELTELSVLDRIHPNDFVKLAKEAPKISQQPSLVLPHYRFRVKSEEYRWFETVLTNELTNPDIEAIIVNTRDITSKKKNEEELEKLSLVARETESAVSITDAEDRITWVNKAFCDITEFSFEEVVGKRASEILHGPHTSKETVNYLKERVEKKCAFNCEILNYTKSGKAFWVEIKGQPILNEKGEVKQIFSIQTDITKRKENEEALKQSEQRYKLLFHGSPRPKWIFKADTFQIVEVNDAALKLYGYTREAFLKKTIPDLKLSEDRVDFEDSMKTFINAKGNTFSRIVRHVKKNGKTFFVEITSHPFQLPSGTHVMVTASDMTEKLELEQKLIEEKLNAQKEIAKAIINAQERERSEVGKELHDNVNQLLAAAKLYVENIKHFPDLSTQFVEKSRDLINKSINEVRFLSKQLVTPTIRDIGFKETIMELMESYTELNVFEIDLHLEMCEDCLENSLQLTIYRIMQEQLNNAVKYAKATKVKISLTQSGNSVRLTYEDNGVGFDMSTKKNGLGLNNIRNRADVHKGNVRIESAIGKGCKMEIHFPHSLN